MKSDDCSYRSIILLFVCVLAKYLLLLLQFDSRALAFLSPAFNLQDTEMQEIQETWKQVAIRLLCEQQLPRVRSPVTKTHLFNV